MQNFPLVSLIVLNYNGLKYLGNGLKECLDSVLKTDYPNLETIFVDNGSTDGSIDFVRKNFKKSKVRVIKNTCNIVAEGYNRGIKVSKGKYIALLSNDMIFDPNWLKQIIRLMEREPHIGIAGCKRMLYGSDNTIDGIGGKLCLDGRAISIGWNEIDEGQYDIVRNDLDYIGGAMVIRKDVLREIGLFDPEYFIFFEDVDLCFRVRKKGYKVVYVPGAVLWHSPSSTIKRKFPTGQYVEYMGNRSRIRFVIIHFVFVRLIATLAIDLVFLLLATPTSKKSLLKAYWWNLKNLANTLKKRLHNKPLPISYAYPVTRVHLSHVLKRLRIRSVVSDGDT